jgi:ABC-type proline/glycine betaine transport system ATPase subunit
VSALLAERVSKRYPGRVALDGVSLEVKRGECVALIGESGSGKTTLLRCFNRLTEPDEGRILVDGVDVTALDPFELRRRTGYVPQEGGLLPHWRVRRNVAMVPWLRGEPESDAAAVRALHLVGLEPERYGAAWPSQLSGGQRQRVAVARALAARPDLVLLDINLAEGSGFDVLRAVHAEAPQIEFYMLSNFAAFPYRDLAERLGARAFFDKSKEFKRVRDLIAQRAAAAVNH